ncbi:MAG TPA: FUN14 domain-containing protein, partial [Planctomycetota bacterium]|nr:FUN14 domain-containing protein [Planctomycetota bacterium]
RDMPRWKKVSLAVAIGTTVIGGILTLAHSGSTPTGTAENPLTTNFAPSSAGTGPKGQPVEEPAAKGVFRLGFSFVAGFCIGSFLRAALKMAAIAVGFWLFLTFVLAWYGIVNVDWLAIQSLWDRFAANVATEWGNFQTFMTGSLPAAGLAVTGLAVGLKRH